MNENIHKIDMQNVQQPSLIFSGISSAKSIKGSDSTPNCEKKTTDENEMSGIQLNVVTSMFQDLSIMYTPKTIKPSAIDMADVTSNT